MLEPEPNFCSPAAVLAMGEFSCLQHENEGLKKKKKEKHVLMKIQGKSYHKQAWVFLAFSLSSSKTRMLHYLQISLGKQVSLHLN